MNSMVEGAILKLIYLAEIFKEVFFHKGDHFFGVEE